MSIEVPMRRKGYRRRIPKIAQRATGNQKESSLPDDNFTKLIRFLVPTMPLSEQQNFSRGANYAKRIISNFTGSGFEVRNETISVFVSELVHNAKDYARQRQFQYDFLDTLEKERGKDLLQLTVPYHSSINPDLAEHFALFENPYVKLGAFTALAITEKQQSMLQTMPVELNVGASVRLQNA